MEIQTIKINNNPGQLKITGNKCLERTKKGETGRERKTETESRGS